MSDQPLSPAEQVRRLYEDAEKRTAGAMEGLVASNAFGEILAMITGNAMAMTKMANTGLDQVVRRARLAGRLDVARLGQQLARTEDKLERLLQLTESLEERVAAMEESAGSDGQGRAPTNRTAAAAQRRTGTKTASTSGRAK